ncbi:MAG TPA: aminotransferase class V-fold PLP-dependent enzyme [Pyrinomonadaceae bacterium]|jgi:selenocysteine lyase/cysteine desulfurase|nr:aminotransferase class V-fold PLP-dependent enzyme [Pyrinomonadaceae bacterium]
MNDTLRALFPVTERVIYLNHAAVSAPPIPTLKAIQSQLADVSENGSVNFRNWIAVKENARRLVAELLGARAEQVAFVRNTSDGLSTVANGLDWRPGDNLVTFRNEFPSNLYPWLRIRDTLGVEVRLCEERQGRVGIDELIALIDSKTRLVAISQVQYASGFRADLERIGRAARVHDALLVVDVIQALGVIPIDVESELVDVAAAACHKWLLTPEGVGLLYLSTRARERIQPTLVGWTSVPNPEDYGNFAQGWNRGTLAWETGTGPVALIHGLEASLNLLNEVGISPIQSHLEMLTDRLCEQLQDTRYEVVSSRRPMEKSQIVCVRHTAGLTSMDLYAHLKKRNIITAPRGDRLRISPHFYNTLEEIDELIKALHQISRELN